MALKFFLETLDDLTDDQKGLYSETDGGFQLKVEGLPEVEDVSGLKKALEAARKGERLAEKYRKMGSIEDLQAMLDEAEENKNKKLMDEGDFEKLLGQHQSKWGKERDELISDRDNATAALKSFVGESAFVTELARNGATEEGIALLPGQFKKRIDVGFADGKPSVQIMSADGETPMAGSENGKANMADLVAEAKEKYPSLFESKARGGSGKEPDDGAGGLGGAGNWADAKNPKEKAALLKQKLGKKGA